MSILRSIGLAGFGVRHVGRMRRGRKAVERHLESPAAVPVPPPTFLQLRLTNLCNLRCKMCGQWGDTGIFRPQGEAAAGDGAAERDRIRDLIGAGRQLGLDDYVRLLDQVQSWNPIVSLFGGEPLLYPDVVPLVREIKRRGMTLSIITNGWRLEELAEDLVDAGVDCLALSIDGPEDLHDRIRGRDSSYAHVVAGLEAIERERKRQGKVLPMQIAIFPVTELNVDRAEEAIEALRRLPVDTVNVGLRWFVPEAAGQDYQRVMRDELGIEATSWTGFKFAWPDAGENSHLRSLVDFLGRVRRRRLVERAFDKHWVAFVPDIEPRDVPAYFSDHSATFGHDLCPVAWYFAQVEPDGNVCFCGDFPDYILGNVRESAFLDIWHGDKATRFRAKLAKEPLPICNRCCGNFVYGKWSRPVATS